MAPPSDGDRGHEIPPPDAAAQPTGFVVLVEPAERIHFLDWGGPPDAAEAGVVLIHGLAGTAWNWTPVARRLRAARRVVAMDLRGHGLSDSPTSGYDRSSLASDVVAVADGSGFVRDAPGVVLAGHGFGACVAVWAAAELGDACRGLVLVDGGWEDLRSSTGEEPDEFLRSLDEPPEVLRSMTAFLADRRAFDPSSWDDDQEHAARATVVETHAGKVVPATRPHALKAMVEAMFTYRPVEALTIAPCPIIVLAAADDEDGSRGAALGRVQDALTRTGGAVIPTIQFPSDGHNLMRYRPAEVSAAIMEVATGADGRRRAGGGG